MIHKAFALDDISEILDQKVNLGLDLKGGTYLVMKGKVEEAINQVALEATGQIKEIFTTTDVSYQKKTPSVGGEILIRYSKESNENEINQILSKQYSQWDVVPIQGGIKLVMSEYQSRQLIEALV